MLGTVLTAAAVLIAAIYGYGILQLPALAMSDPLGPRAFPILLTVALLLTAVLLFAEGRKKPDWRAGIDAIGLVIRTDLKVVVPAALWLALYFAAFERLGYLLSTAVFLAGMMVAAHTGRRWTAIVTALGYAIVSYGFFVGLFDVPLPRGVMPV